MHPFLITLAAICALPVTSHADGTVHRTDMEGEDAEAPVTEDALVAAIADAIRKLQAEAAGAGEAAATADSDEAAALKAEILELQGKLAVLESDKADRDAADMEEEAKADRAELEGLAERLHYDCAAWTDATTNGQRKLDLAKHKGLLPAEAELQSETKADGVPAPKLDGMVSALHSMHPNPQAGSRVDAYADLEVAKAPPATGGNWGGPRARTDEAAKPADPMKAAVAKRNRDRLDAEAARAARS